VGHRHPLRSPWLSYRENLIPRASEFREDPTGEILRGLHGLEEVAPEGFGPRRYRSTRTTVKEVYRTMAKKNPRRAAAGRKGGEKSPIRKMAGKMGAKTRKAKRGKS
jgi:hypothetical protein